MPAKLTLGRPADVPVIAPAIGDDEQNELRTLVTVARTHKADFGERQVFVRIDGGERMTLRFGESITREVGPGSHTLRAHNTLFWKTVPFTVEPGEHLEFVILNHGTRLTLGLAGLLGAAPLYLKIFKRSLI